MYSKVKPLIEEKWEKVIKTRHHNKLPTVIINTKQQIYFNVMICIDIVKFFKLEKIGSAEYFINADGTKLGVRFFDVSETDLSRYSFSGSKLIPQAGHLSLKALPVNWAELSKQFIAPFVWDVKNKLLVVDLPVAP